MVGCGRRGGMSAVEKAQEDIEASTNEMLCCFKYHNREYIYQKELIYIESINSRFAASLLNHPNHLHHHPQPRPFEYSPAVEHRKDLDFDDAVVWR